MDYEGHWLYKEICSMSREFRYSIRHMPVEYRYEIGRDIRAILRELKYKAYKAIKKLCLRFLCRLIILHHPERDCVKRGNPRLWGKLPPYKSMFVVGKNNKGLAIGNLTSQMFANFYLTPLDYFITEVLGLELHVRYADDFIIGHHDLGYLKKCIPIIRNFAEKILLLTIHPDKLYIQECHKGVQFIGAIVLPNRIYCSNRSIVKFRNKIHGIEIDEHAVASINSYLGLMGHYNTYHIRKKMIQHLPNLEFGEGYRKVKLVH